MDDRWEAASYAWVRIEQLGHFCGVACEDHDEVITAIFDLLDKCVESFAAKAVLRVLDKRVRFINKEHTTERTLDDVGNFDGSLPLVCSDEATTVNLDKMAAPKLPECTKYAGDGARDSRLACTRIAMEDHVAARAATRGPETGNLDGGDALAVD
mmetsp:Transcript_1415/g.4098  ORF Transcript_1415/g.4098 Transcript_1415/m.4098 type:complete len:155 (-) Transcript_1415:500-964(-)